jgi:hypothetical protein
MKTYIVLSSEELSIIAAYLLKGGSKKVRRIGDKFNRVVQDAPGVDMELIGPDKEELE